MTEKTGITHNEEDYAGARGKLRQALHSFYEHDDERTANALIAELSEVTGVHHQESEVCKFRVLHNAAVQATEEMWRNGPTGNVIYQKCPITRGADECDKSFEETDKVMLGYLENLEN